MSPSPSGVASLRARFEQNQQDSNTSPPSRGRSPAGSVASEGSRPLSKVRTSFVAVESNGHMASTREVPTALAISNDVAQESKSTTSLNGHVATSAPMTNGDDAGSGQINGLGNDGNADKPIAATEDSKDAVASSNDHTMAENTQGLGSILKGSPFEGEETKREPAPQKTVTRPKTSKQPSKGMKAKSTAASTKSSMPEPAPQSVKQVAPIATSGPTNSQLPDSRSVDSIAPSDKAKNKDATKSQPQTDSMVQSRSAIQTQKLSSDTEKFAKATSGEPTADKDSVKSPPTPPTASVTATSQNQLPASVASPKALPSPASNKPKEPSPQPKKTLQKATNRLSTAAKAPIAAAKSATSRPTPSNTTAAKPTKKTAPTSPPGAKKPRPKSPTRPVRLPASATAPTAASSAKHDGEGVALAPRSPSRQSKASAGTKERSVSLNKATRSARASLPAHSRPMDKLKTKPRTSMAGATAPSGGFLERMMRPTQSSAQKTHEKVEPKSPPRKTAQSGYTFKPKRRSGGSSGAKSEDKGGGPIEEPALQTEGGKDIGLAMEAADAQPLPLTDPTATKSDEVVKGVENAAPTTTVEAKST